jgi:cGMP-dependent protein kinase
MKCLSKGYIVKTHMQDSVMNEKYILQMCNSPFIIRLYATYNGTQTLYFLMEAALGGELYATYNRKGFHGSDKHCKFYAAGVVNSFDYIHERRVIYRDLKPENILMDAKGMFKLTDMGLAKFVIGKTYTTCGTPDYFAPEIIASTGHNKAVDWWTLGILVFELMSGHPPFESNYPMQIYNKVMMGIGKVHFPPKCNGEPGEVIRGLLNKEPAQRLPMRAGGVQNLKTQKWFTTFEWDEFGKQTMRPPFVPVVKNPNDTANFSARPEDRPQQIAYVDDGSGWDRDFEEF